jgi:hypothetical protein
MFRHIGARSYIGPSKNGEMHNAKPAARLNFRIGNNSQMQHEISRFRNMFSVLQFFCNIAVLSPQIMVSTAISCA